MPKTDYQTFLKSKKDNHQSSLIMVGDSQINQKLFPFQRRLVRWALERGKCALFAACGLGKTPMQLEWANQIYKRTGEDILILSPLAVAKQTVREGEKFGINVNLCRSQFDVQDGINITNYDMVDNFQANRFTGIILDESSILKNLMGKTRTHLIEMFSQTPYKLCCSATPAPNDYTELGNHSEFLNVKTYNEMLSKYFINDSAKTGDWRIKKHAVKEFWAWVSSWAACLNKPSDIGYSDEGFDLPPLNWLEVICRSKFTEPANGELFPDIKQSATGLYKNLKATIEDRAEAIRSLVHQSKDYWIIWVNTNHEADVLKKAIPQAIELRGSESIQDKERKLSDFSQGKSQIIITKPTIAGFGLNWQHCHNMAFVGMNYSFEQSYQAMRRCWRFQQQNPVNVYVIISDTEAGVLDSVKKKAEAHKKMEEEMINLATFDTQDKASSRIYDKVYEGKNWKIINGDCVEVSKTIPDESIDFSIFSPPFSSIFVYSDYEEDMGNSINDEQFFQHFSFLVPELLRITKPGRLCAVHCSVLPQFKFKDGAIGLKDFRGDIIRLFIQHGWIFHAEVCIWKCPVTEMTRTKALGLLYKQIKKDSSMCRTGLPDYLVVFRKPGENVTPIIHTPEDFPLDDWQNIASPVWMDIKQSNVLNVKRARHDKDERHICPLQLDVINRSLRLWSNPGDLVLSPFAGIGSEGYESLRMNRRFLGIELKPEYVKIACENLSSIEEQPGMFGE